MSPAVSAFLKGARKSVPILVSASPFGALFGAIAVDNGLSVGEVGLMSATVYAGASQMVGLKLFGTAVAPWLIVFSIFAVNFRHVLYSATLGRKLDRLTSVQKFIAFFFLVDPQFAEAEKQTEAGRPITFAWYMGVALPVYIFWVGLSVLGALFGRLITDPQAIGIDFLLPIYFLGLVMEFRARAHWLPVVVASGIGSIVAYHLVGSPWHVSLGALAGILLAAFLAPGDSESESPAVAEGEAR